MSSLEKLGKAQKPPQVCGRCPEHAEGFPEGTKKEKGREGEGEGDVILLMCARASCEALEAPPIVVN